jgi:hypothetical protein
MRAQSSRSRDFGFNPLKAIAVLEANMTSVRLILAAMAFVPVTPTASTSRSSAVSLDRDCLAGLATPQTLLATV